MNILVIGHSVVDKIKSEQNIQVKPGGIFYTSLGLMNLKNDEDNIILLSFMDKTNFPLFEYVFGRINISNIEWCDKIPEVNLTILKDQERWEHYTHIMPEIEIPTNIEFTSLDGILLNMISGFDISLNKLENIRKIYNGPIYMDVHTLSRGVGNHHHRYFRKIPDFNLWLKNINIVQANENEIRTFCEFENERDIVAWTMEQGVEQLIVTKGDKGVTHYSFENGNIIETNLDALKVNSINKVGCGDIFGSVYFYSYLTNADIGKSLNIAKRAAGLISTFTELNEFYELKNRLDELND